MDTTKEQAVALLNRFMSTPNPQVLLLNGTNQHAKHPLALHAALGSGAKSILFRINSASNADVFLRDVCGTSIPRPRHPLRFRNGAVLHLDTFNRRSWNSTPSQIDVAIVYPIDSLGPDSGTECINDLVGRGTDKILLVTCTDNKDFSWAYVYNPVRVTYDSESEKPDYHERVRAIEADARPHAPSGLPRYANATPPELLVRLHCRGCNAGRLARLNQRYPGLEILRSAEAGEYLAVCLKCGEEADDNYNWYGQP